MLQGRRRWESGCGEGQPLSEARSREPYLNVQTTPIKDQVGGGGSPQGTPRPGAGPLRCSPELWREPALGAPLLAEGPAQLRHGPSHLAPRPPAAPCVSLHHARLPSDGGLLCPEAEDSASPRTANSEPIPAPHPPSARVSLHPGGQGHRRDAQPGRPWMSILSIVPIPLEPPHRPARCQAHCRLRGARPVTPWAAGLPLTPGLSQETQVHVLPSLPTSSPGRRPWPSRRAEKMPTTFGVSATLLQAVRLRPSHFIGRPRFKGNHFSPPVVDTGARPKTAGGRVHAHRAGT